MKRSSVDSVLDATYEVVLGVGVKRTTFADIARAAGMSRATLYTHFDDVGDAVASLLTRELVGVLSAAQPPAGTERDALDRLLATVDTALRTLPEHPLVRKVLDVDPHVLLPYLVERFGVVQRTALQVLEDLVVRGQADGSICDADPALLAHVVLVTVQSALVSHRISAAELGAPQVRGAVLELLRGGLAATAPPASVPAATPASVPASTPQEVRA